MFLLFYIMLLIFFLYALLIVRYAIGWKKIKYNPDKNFFPRVSVVIAVRNEEKHIDSLVSSLRAQVYPFEKIEFIIVNDHSTDNTLSLLEHADLSNLKLLNVPHNHSGKKYAINMAVSEAKGEIILASDADCSFSSNWIQTIVRYFKNNNVNFVSGPVFFHKQSGFFQSFQALEFASLIGSGAGAIGIQNPIFCNGANMAYRKDVFLQLSNFKKDNIVSGDDVFLLHNIKANFPNSIVFAKDNNAVVITESMKNFRDFINQRKRWTAKSSAYTDITSVYISYLVLSTNVIFSVLFLTGFLNFISLRYFFGFFIFKYLADLCLLLPTLKFFKRQDLIKWIFLFELFYSFYIILVVILSFTNKFEWKDRIHKK